MCDTGFFQYLHKEKKYPEVLELAGKCNEESDLINYYRALAHYRLKNNEALESIFQKLSSSAYSNRLKILSNQQKLSAGETDITYPETSRDTLEFEILHLQYMGSLLLKKDLETFFLVYSGKRCTQKEVLAIEFNVYMYYNELLRLPHKRKGIAALLSAVVPGLGKAYAGKPLEGIMSLSPVLANGIQAYEGYYKKGFESPHLYVFGGIGTVFYLSNIYGSAKTAGVKNYEEKAYTLNRLHADLVRLAELSVPE